MYRRATHGYAGSVGADPQALRICTVEAVALLLEELGEPPASLGLELGHGQSQLTQTQTLTLTPTLTLP